MALPAVASGTLFTYAELSLGQDFKTLFTRLLKPVRISAISAGACFSHVTDYFGLMPKTDLGEPPDTVSPHSMMANQHCVDQKHYSRVRH